MRKPREESAPNSRSWLVFGAALLTGFIAAGTVARSPITGLLLVLSLFIAAFLAALAHSVISE
jgi:hypothetical protein